MRHVAVIPAITGCFIILIPALLLSSLCSAETTTTDRDGNKVVSHVVSFPAPSADGPPGGVSWGEATSCSGGGIVAAVCGSGADADCQTQPTEVLCTTTDEKVNGYPLVWPAHSPDKYYAYSWGERIVCPVRDDTILGNAQQVLVGVCGSGADADCDGKSSYALCQSLFYGDGNIYLPSGVEGMQVGASLSDQEWISNSEWGGWANCPEGKVATGFCGSGANKDCNGNVVEIQCSTVTFSRTYIE